MNLSSKTLRLSFITWYNIFMAFILITYKYRGFRFEITVYLLDAMRIKLHKIKRHEKRSAYWQIFECRGKSLLNISRAKIKEERFV